MSNNIDSAKEILISSDQQFWLILINLTLVFIFKVILLFIAYLVIKLGYQLLVDGVKGEFKFKSNISGLKADLVSASPGTFFLLLGVIVLIFALKDKKNIEVDQYFEQNPETAREEATENASGSNQININKPHLNAPVPAESPFSYHLDPTTNVVG